MEYLYEENEVHLTHNLHTGLLLKINFQCYASVLLLIQTEGYVYDSGSLMHTPLLFSPNRTNQVLGGRFMFGLQERECDT